LVIDDGSTDGTSELLAARSDITVVQHRENLGYGAALISAFDYAISNDFEYIVTIDCDGQHEPQRIPSFFEFCKDVDIVSGSRYLQDFDGDNAAPEKRREVNQLVTAELNKRLGLQLTDAFCGFKAYRVSALKKMTLTETGYAMPLELWVQASHAKLRIIESAVPRIYLDHSRTFGGLLDDTSTRLEYYHLVINRSLAAISCDDSTPCSVGSKRKENA
jgi:dolichol-phosphate mannosyltransferase